MANKDTIQAIAKDIAEYNRIVREQMRKKISANQLYFLEYAYKISNDSKDYLKGELREIGIVQADMVRTMYDAIEPLKKDETKRDIVEKAEALFRTYNTPEEKANKQLKDYWYPQRQEFSRQYYKNVGGGKYRAVLVVKRSQDFSDLVEEYYSKDSFIVYINHVYHSGKYCGTEYTYMTPEEYLTSKLLEKEANSGVHPISQDEQLTRLEINAMYGIIGDHVQDLTRAASISYVTNKVFEQNRGYFPRTKLREVDKTVHGYLYDEKVYATRELVVQAFNSVKEQLKHFLCYMYVCGELESPWAYGLEHLFSSRLDKHDILELHDPPRIKDFKDIEVELNTFEEEVTAVEYKGLFPSATNLLDHTIYSRSAYKLQQKCLQRLCVANSADTPPEWLEALKEPDLITSPVCWHTYSNNLTVCPVCGEPNLTCTLPIALDAHYVGAYLEHIDIEDIIDAKEILRKEYHMSEEDIEAIIQHYREDEKTFVYNPREEADDSAPEEPEESEEAEESEDEESED